MLFRNCRLLRGSSSFHPVNGYHFGKQREAPAVQDGGIYFAAQRESRGRISLRVKQATSDKRSWPSCTALIPRSARIAMPRAKKSSPGKGEPVDRVMRIGQPQLPYTQCMINSPGRSTHS